MPEIRPIIFTHIAVVALLTAGIAVLGSSQQAVSCLLGGCLIGLNIALLAWTLKRIFMKKSVALAGFVIVIKYAAFIAILMALYASGWRADFGFVLGLSTALPTVAWAAFRYLKQGETNGSF